MMCLGIPGKVVEIFREDDLLMGRVDFGGVVKRVCLETTPEIVLGDYALVHVGFSIARMNEAEAKRVFELLDGMEEWEEWQDGGSDEVSGRISRSGSDGEAVPRD